MLELFYGFGGWIAKATIKSGDSPFKKKSNRFVPSQQYSKEIKQKIDEANRTWSVYDSLNSSKCDENEDTDNCIVDATVTNVRQRTVSFSDDVLVHTYEERPESPLENSDNSS